MSKKYTLSNSKTNKETDTDAWPQISADERAMVQDIFHKMVFFKFIRNLSNLLFKKLGQKP